jgi:RNA polymerase sigma-70 factor, ECF subfamily
VDKMTDVFHNTLELQDLRRQGTGAVPGLFRRYRQRLLRMIALRLDCRVMVKVDSEDLLQEVFMQAVRRLPQYLDQAAVPVYVWLRQLASQAVIDTHRRFLGAQMRNVYQEADLCWAQTEASSACLAGQLADSLTTPSQCAVREETAAAARAVLDKLEPIDREVLLLRHLEEMSNGEVAAVLGIDKCAASKRYLRALARLRGMMPVQS